jgi:hypothetical protein
MYFSLKFALKRDRFTHLKGKSTKSNVRSIFESKLEMCKWSIDRLQSEIKINPKYENKTCVITGNSRDKFFTFSTVYSFTFLWWLDYDLFPINHTPQEKGGIMWLTIRCPRLATIWNRVNVIITLSTGTSGPREKR